MLGLRRWCSAAPVALVSRVCALALACGLLCVWSCACLIAWLCEQTSPDNEVQVEWRNERKEAMLYFDRSFELHDDVTVLEFMRMAQVEDEAELRRVFAKCPDVASLLLERAPGIVCHGGGSSAQGADVARGAAVKTEARDWREGGSK